MTYGQLFSWLRNFHGQLLATFCRVYDWESIQLTMKRRETFCLWIIWIILCSLIQSGVGHVIVQVGSRITSKRISQMLEDCFPCAHVLVENHPCRHDPSHIVTHRIQSTITQFTDCLLKANIPQISSKWCGFLKAVDKMVAWEISFLIHSEYSLTEPYVAYVILELLHCESAACPYGMRTCMDVTGNSVLIIFL